MIGFNVLIGDIDPESQGLSIRIFIVEFLAFGALRSIKIRISAMIESTKTGVRNAQSPEAESGATKSLSLAGDGSVRRAGARTANYSA
jgi:hypothetical protein